MAKGASLQFKLELLATSRIMQNEFGVRSEQKEHLFDSSYVVLSRQETPNVKPEDFERHPVALSEKEAVRKRQQITLASKKN